MTSRKLLINDSDCDEEKDYDDWESDFDDKNQLFPAKNTKRGKVVLGAGIMAGIILLVVLLLVLLLDDSAGDLDPPDPDSPLGPSDVVMGVFPKAAVVTNGYLCATIGKDVLSEGGSAVDAAIAALLCEGVMNLQSMGVGGGFLMTIYIRNTTKADVLNARETAPAAATENMYHEDSSLSQRGGLSVAIPGELRGYEAAYNKYGGKVPWQRLLQPTIDICRNGFNVTSYLAGILQRNEADILKNEGLREILVDPSTGEVLKEGDLLKNLKLADTLQKVAEEGANAIYSGSLTDALVQDIRNAGGIITRSDFESYKPVWEPPVTSRFANHSMYSVPVPGSGQIVAFILNIVDNYLPFDNDVLKTHRIIEAFKFAYGRRTKLGDYSQPSFVPNVTEIEELIFNLTSIDYAKQIRELISDSSTNNDPTYYGAVLAQPEDHGTANMAVMAANGDAVIATSTINLILGSQFVSPSTGIILNDEMDDFSSPGIVNGFGLPASPANFIRPGKRPLSSMAPSIFVDGNGDVSLLAGSAGGSRITTSTALMAIHNLLEGKTIKEAIDAARIHHQLFPMSVEYEYGILKFVVEGLQDLGHETVRATSVGSTATGIARLGNSVTACYDYRRGGAVDGF